jgi:hypothetical protein
LTAGVVRGGAGMNECAVMTGLVGEAKLIAWIVVAKAKVSSSQKEGIVKFRYTS